VLELLRQLVCLPPHYRSTASRLAEDGKFYCIFEVVALVMEEMYDSFMSGYTIVMLLGGFESFS